MAHKPMEEGEVDGRDHLQNQSKCETVGKRINHDRFSCEDRSGCSYHDAVLDRQ